MCNNFTEEAVCEFCRSERRDSGLLCVVEMPADLMMMEQAQCYRGMYFVLMERMLPETSEERAAIAEKLKAQFQRNIYNQESNSTK